MLTAHQAGAGRALVVHLRAGADEHPEPCIYAVQPQLRAIPRLVSLRRAFRDADRCDLHPVASASGNRDIVGRQAVWHMCSCRPSMVPSQIRNNGMETHERLLRAFWMLLGKRTLHGGKRRYGMDHDGSLEAAPLFAPKDYEAPSLFPPQSLLREARRQKGLPPGTVPEVCVLDPDGDLVDHLQVSDRLSPHHTWACYHTRLDTFAHEDMSYGVIGRVVGAPFAVLVAEELFASGCRLLISITSAGQILPLAPPPYVILIEKALRDEGTSYHYVPPAPYSHLDHTLREMVSAQWDYGRLPLHVGASWTTDAPFRETAAMIARCRAQGILAVEMEAAALYALAQARQYLIICFAHVTNQMGQSEGDFEKGEASGSETALYVVSQTARSWRQRQTGE